jgi:DNA-binding response OmpR family regulator
LNVTDRKKTVLVVEDEEALAKAIAATLNEGGLETVIAHRGSDALELTRRLHPDLVLLDVMMFGMSGFEVCARLTSDPETSDIPVIIVTAKAEEEDRAVGIAAGATAYVTKPFSPVRLIKLVKQTLAKDEGESQPEGPSIDTMTREQLTVYARDLRKLWERERRELQRERHERVDLEQARERLAQLERVKAEFLDVLNQELLTPLAPINAILERLQRQSTSCSPDVRGSLNNLQARIAGLQRRVRGAVEFAELVNKQPEPGLGYHALQQVIPRAVEPVALMARGRDVDFRVLVPSDLPKVRIYPKLVGEAALQMAQNAVIFNRPGGRAKLRARLDDDAAVIEVSDTGFGLAEERLAALTGPFEERADALLQDEEGLGGSWAFVRYVAEIHGGWTDVKSAGEGKGATFALAVPLEKEPTTRT